MLWRSALTLDQCIDYLLTAAMDRAVSKADFASSTATAVTGEAVLAELRPSLGDKWVSNFASDGVDIDARVLERMRWWLGKKPTSTLTAEALRGQLWTAWTEQGRSLTGGRGVRRNPRFWRGKRVDVRPQSQTESKLNPDYRTQWYPARIIGIGSLPNTFEVLFDQPLENDRHDRHARVFPFLDRGNSASFRAGQVLGNGTVTIREPTDAFAHDTVRTTSRV
eukprot:COSAG01_NODE_20354_length_958_cov_1.295693_1_plen_222_part_00